MTHSAPAPFDALDPGAVFAAAESIGLQPSGRLFALNSYENRVYQLGDDDGALWVLKFYRPARWSDAQIGEEHAFTLEMAAAELPVAAPIERDGESLFVHQRLRFAAFPYLAGRAPELDDKATLTLLGRTLARMHAIGNRAPFRHRPALTLERLGVQARSTVQRSGFVPEALEEQYARVSEQVIGRVRQCLDNFGPLPRSAYPRRLPRRQHPVARERPAVRGPGRLHVRSAHPGPVDVPVGRRRQPAVLVGGDHGRVRVVW